MFSTLDWTLILCYLIFAFGVGILMTNKASKDLSSYFVADRSLPWWWLGTSMVATTFAADTPLAITGIVANSGISGNWFWWSWILTYITMTIFFAKKWRQSKVLTDVEFIELRYEGKSASFLRAFKAFYFSIIINCVILGWVFRAMSKITDPFIHWKDLLGVNNFNTLSYLWPEFLIFDNFNNTLTVLAIFMVVIGYSSLGGIRGVILTDLFQFVLAMVSAILFAVYAIDYIGGLESLYEKMHLIYPDNADSYLNIMPTFDSVMFPFQVFLIFILVQWWSQYFSDGSGYYAQRMNAAKTPEDAEKGALWFTIANFGLRTWPWIIIGLVALVVFPMDNPTQYHEMGSALASDREMGYPILMKLILPSGLLGLVFVSLMAAFMSTVDTHINWGASYLINDLYKRFIDKDASDRKLVWASRLAVIGISIIAILIASQINSIEGAWKFLMALASGLGMPHILRWIWWRTNAWTEITSMITAFFMSISLYYYFPDVRSDYIICMTALTSVMIAIVVTLITEPVKESHLKIFVEKVSPFGFWRGYEINYDGIAVFKERLVMWGLGVVATFCAMFSIGYLLQMQWLTGSILMIVFIVSFRILIKKM